MPGMEIFLLLVVLAAGWFWFDSLQAREAAVQAARTACEAEGVLLLDWTVATTSTRIVRNDRGRVRLQRAYAFEYSDTGNNRLPGSVVLRGRRVILLNVGLREPRLAETHQPIDNNPTLH